jgi:thiol-disulfide isomerase/thioredoxin
VRRALLVVAVSLLACKREHEAVNDRPPAPAPAPPPPAPIIASAGPPELLVADGAPMRPMDLAAYRKELVGSTAVVVATAFPDGLTANAGAGVNLQVGGKNVSWVFDGDPKNGYWLAYDENANGDLRDDPRHVFAAKDGVLELALTLHVDGEIRGSVLDAPIRLRFRGGELYRQEGTVRRGELALPKGPMTFALLGDLGRYGQDYQLLAFDLDRDGTLELQALDAPEQIRVFEQTVTLDDRGYAFSIDPGGDTLTLAPVAARLPPRAPLRVGTLAPEIELTTFDAKHVKLSELRGKVVLVDFWATSCHPCVKALPRLAELRAKDHDKGFELVAIAMPSDDVQSVLGANAAGIDAADEAAQTAYRVDRFPTYFLLDRDGKILCSRCTLDAIEPMIASHLAPT